MKSLIYAAFRWVYLNIVQTDSPAPPGFQLKLQVCVMTLSTFERSLDKIAPAFLMILGLVAAVGSAGLGF